ncbi:BLUF domain-containing protein [Pelagicoccus sp. SDUM812003]|uniref:BLUF domain-containing protein n=1 Tax=Pelagicoccus sp. SDUM812003 TaxID=3041267 RepID=UPI00280C93C4|nr:BLUF domain-containing protein [Pelagicoccus sp. SDUM812003]MDQ8203364.1 BLUF domain-containing protein [Pelagicoccus sp. SDUM812003]
MRTEDELLLVCYVSSACEQVDESMLDELMKGSRERNERRGVTGLLLYSDGSFMQILEGPPRSVISLLHRIEEDPRHRKVQRLLRRRTNERFFGDWSMACRRMTEDERRGIGAYAGLLDQADQSEEDLIYRETLPSWIQRLVREFQRINR